MKEGIHPTYFPEATVTCACGNSWTTGSTQEHIHTDVCSECHPFFTGEQRIVDTEGQVDRFYRRLEARQEHLQAEREREEAKTSPELPLTELDVKTRVTSTLAKASITTAGQVLEELAKGDKALLEVDGFGRKSLADLKRSMKRRGYELPEPEAEGEPA
jgi:large subunit ribosomal protein L31